MSHRLYTNTSCVFYCSLLFILLFQSSCLWVQDGKLCVLNTVYSLYYYIDAENAMHYCWFAFVLLGCLYFFFYFFAYYTNEWVFGSEERSGWFSHYEADHTSFPIVEWLLSILVSFYFWSGPWIYLSDGRLQAQTLSE